MSLKSLDGATLLITGGTGSFGRRLAATLLRDARLRRLIVLSRDELKQSEMREALPERENPSLRFFLGDVRDRDRLHRAFNGVDYVVHAAAIKQVPAAEYNPFEAIKTNVLGAQNVIEEAIDRGLKGVVALSTDKAANPINLYGATKLCSDKLFVAGNAYVGGDGTKFSVVRYGNVVGSRGSVVPLFQRLRSTGVVPITDARMTRFWITLQQGVQFVLDSLLRMRGGEIFVPKIPSIRVTDLATALAPECRQEIVGIRPGEKLHEVLVPEDDARSAVDLGDRYAILPAFGSPGAQAWRSEGRTVPDGFRYASDTNDRWLTVDELRSLSEPKGVA
jgi:UDP-N-acetylglucosamine 4,6-dehydratase/5-epimerase